MKSKYDFIHFVEVADGVYSCRNNKRKDELGRVEWHPRWKEYCYFTTIQAVYSDSCLDDINHFISQLEHAENND